MTPESVLEWRRWAGDSPLYQKLCEVIAEDPELMRVLAGIAHPPAINVLFAAVQYLMAGGDRVPLADYYPNLSADPLPASGVSRAFRDFVLDNETEILWIGETRYTQTNECRRCLALLPMMWMSGFDRFHLVDVGTSAGLNLALDRYRYRWDELEWGPDSSVTLTGESRGVAPVPSETLILRRIGIDLDPVDPGDHDQRLWLEALVWPEHHERRARLRAALEVAAGVDLELISGNALEKLPEVLDGLSDGAPVVVMNSFVLNQFSSDERLAFHRGIQLARARRPVFSVSMEAAAKGETPVVVLSVDDGSGPSRVGVAHHHGEWIDLYSRP